MLQNVQSVLPILIWQPKNYKKTGQSDGYKVKVETQGASGTEDTLTADDIKTADFVVLAIDVAIDGMERFVGKRVVFSTTAEAIKDPQKLIDAGKHAGSLYR